MMGNDAKKALFPNFFCFFGIFKKNNFKIVSEKKRGKWVVKRENERLLNDKLIFQKKF